MLNMNIIVQFFFVIPQFLHVKYNMFWAEHYKYWHFPVSVHLLPVDIAPNG